MTLLRTKLNERYPYFFPPLIPLFSHSLKREKWLSLTNGNVTRISSPFELKEGSNSGPFPNETKEISDGGVTVQGNLSWWKNRKEIDGETSGRGYGCELPEFFNREPANWITKFRRAVPVVLNSSPVAKELFPPLSNLSLSLSLERWLTFTVVVLSSLNRST